MRTLNVDIVVVFRFEKWRSRSGMMVLVLLCFVTALSGADGCAVISELIAQGRDESGLLPGMGTSFVTFGVICFHSSGY